MHGSPRRLQEKSPPRQGSSRAIRRSQVANLREAVAALRDAGDLVGATRALEQVRQGDPEDAALQQEYGALIVERIAAGEAVPNEERAQGAALLVGLAEIYDGEHGLAYSAGALDIDPGHDRAVQLYGFYAQAIGREDDVGARYLAYITANPNGAMVAEARWLLAASYEGAGQIDHAIAILEPLRAVGDPEAAAKVRQLYGQIGKPMPSATAGAHESFADAQPNRRGSANVDRADAALDAAQALASEGKRLEAYKKYREVLELDPVHPEALSWVQDYLRTKRDYAPLRDVLLAAVRASGESVEARRDRLREVAGLCG